MKNFILILTFTLFSSIVSAQKITSCENCNTTKYNLQSIKENHLHELELLRNEIFARHGYQFNNDRLDEYFSNFYWYKGTTKNVSLNFIEQHNVTLFKTQENKIKQHRKKLISELQKLKKAVLNNDTDFIKNVFDNYTSENGNDYPYEALVNALESVLKSTDIDAMYWHKNQAKYSIEIDNGFSVSSKGIYIKNDTISIIVTDPQKHSSLMKDDAFEYPSSYYSESENSAGGVFEFSNGKLKLVNLYFAG
ncbi:YARHG domain-containing protein [uncultured Tenacibaculum sp.]|uniref:YARHG domain-containing protein n=1 Tax=uncultured Tenacibaculum sp. TaxID=174713 RepID=UPI002614C636|nr:YARHG domain-containing protein [uncultured Tenacibaculum sp.]